MASIHGAFAGLLGGSDTVGWCAFGEYGSPRVHL